MKTETPTDIEEYVEIVDEGRTWSGSYVSGKTVPDLDSLGTGRIISIEEAKTVKGSVYFTKDGPIVWE